MKEIKDPMEGLKFIKILLILVSLFLIFYGVICMIMQEAAVGKCIPREAHGISAIAWGLFYLILGIFILWNGIKIWKK